MKKDVFGKEGDFTTSPEISQMFGEVCNAFEIYVLFSVWCWVNLAHKHISFLLPLRGSFNKYTFDRVPAP